ncbi:hypothetical protein [Halobellus captivus]|uniref:hypothetical protein n=1 Tax=Halobellus captivus TaxID=2592614 RepID=UPI0011A76C4D|nr:hypothetical protein [Halobellus captivus]
MQGGLVAPTEDAQVTTTAAGGAPPSATGSPALPDTAQTQSQPPGVGPGVAASVATADLGEMVLWDRLLAGTSWSRRDIELGLQVVSTAILLFWVINEVQR